MGLTSIGSAIVPIISNNLSSTQIIDTQNSRSINYDKEIILATSNNTRGWRFFFNWNWESWLPNEVEVYGDGITMVIYGFGNSWTPKIKSFSINPNADRESIYREKRTDAWPIVEEAKLTYSFIKSTEEQVLILNLQFTLLQWTMAHLAHLMVLQDSLPILRLVIN